MLLQTSPGGSESDWSLAKKRSPLPSVAIRRRKGTNQEHFTKGRQRKPEPFPPTPSSRGVALSKNCVLGLFLGLFPHHPVVHFVQTAQGQAHCTAPPHYGQWRERGVWDGFPTLWDGSRKPTGVPDLTQLRGADQRFAGRLSISFTSLPLYYCWHLIYNPSFIHFFLCKHTQIAIYTSGTKLGPYAHILVTYF